MSPAQIEPISSVGSLVSPAVVEGPVAVDKQRRFPGLRGVQWRVNLGILPSSSSASIDEIRRVTADSRRRYAGLRRRLLVDPQILKDVNNTPDLAMDNPLSQNPDSTWGRFFRNAELEKMVDQDLSRLYPEHGSYFQTPGCQGMLRRILLLWCLTHTEYGYRQGMHELLAPLLYVLHVDVEHLSQVRKLYEDHFTDKFDSLSFHDSDLTYNFDYRKPPDSIKDQSGYRGNAVKVRNLEELDPEIQNIFLLSDAYGAEGELGIVLSEKFLEHDAYCMFEALMGGNHGAVAMADFFSASPAGGSYSGLSPIIEASSALYHLLSLVDLSLHTHLVELGVEPQYFALRWLRVLFGREFSLEHLLIIWDEIFASDNSKLFKDDVLEAKSWFGILNSHRGAFICGIAVSLLLYLRSSLLATENATSCLQRLLNFAETIDLEKLQEKALSLQTLALDANISSLHPPLDGDYNRGKSVVRRDHILSSDSILPKTPLRVVPDSYWEEKWRVLHRGEVLRHCGSANEKATLRNGSSEKERFLSRRQSEPPPSIFKREKDAMKSSVRRRLLKDLSQELGLEEDTRSVVCSGEVEGKDSCSLEGGIGREERSRQDLNSTVERRHFGGVNGNGETLSPFSFPNPIYVDNQRDNDSGRSKIASNLFPDENDDPSQVISEGPDLPVSSGPPESISEKSECDSDIGGTLVTESKDHKILSGGFHWLWKLGRSSNGGGASEERGISSETAKCDGGDSSRIHSNGSSSAYGICDSSVGSKNDSVEQNVIGTLRRIGQSMLEHIQVIEAVFQQEGSQVGSLENSTKGVSAGKGQVAALAALKELRKISSFLSEM